jgi:hypothetical protein
MPARRFVLLALVAGSVVGVALSYPLVLHPSTIILDDGTLDAFQFTWNLWWLRASLVDLHTNPFFTRLLFYPQGVSLLFHTLSASLGVATIPLQLLLAPVTAHNVLVIASPALLVTAVGLLAREVTGDAWAGLAAGLMAALTGSIVWYLPIVYLTATYLVAAVLWAWIRLHRRRRAADVALVLVLVVATIFASQEYGMMALALLALDTAARLVAPDALGLRRPWMGGLVAVWGTAAVGLGALAVFATKNAALPPPAEQILLGSGFLAGFVTPPWLVAPRLAFWIVLYVGTAPLVLALGLGWLGGRRALFWTAATVVTLLMACGPFVGLQHPLVGVDPPPTDLTTPPPGHVSGPYRLALAILPLLRAFRAAYRWVAVADIALAVVAATGIAGLRARIAHPTTRALVTACLLAAVLLGGAVDVRGISYRIESAVVPPAYETIRDDPEPAAVLELPVGLTTEVFPNLASRYMYYQTLHRKYLLDGTVSRLPEGVAPLVTRPIVAVAEKPWVKYVVIHRDLLEIVFPVSKAQVAQIEPFLAEHATLVRRDGPLELYRLDTFRPESVKLR